MKHQIDQAVTPHPGPPGYWMHETGGELAPAIKRYLENEPLTIRDVSLIRAYIKQWVYSEVWDGNPKADDESRATLAGLRLQALTITDRKTIDAWIEAALDEGMDPL
jgi:hypothetical protein